MEGADWCGEWQSVEELPFDTTESYILWAVRWKNEGMFAERTPREIAAEMDGINRKVKRVRSRLWDDIRGNIRETTKRYARVKLIYEMMRKRKLLADFE
jgi:hypothetical protein